MLSRKEIEKMERCEKLCSCDNGDILRDKKGQYYVKNRYWQVKKARKWRNAGNLGRDKFLALPYACRRILTTYRPLTKEEAAKWCVKEFLSYEFRDYILSALRLQNQNAKQSAA